MTKIASEFNERYGLSVTEAGFKKVKPDALASEIAGKPKRNIVEVLKRFFRNPAAVASLIVFVGLVLCSIIIPQVSHYSATEPVLTTSNIKVLAYSHLLPPEGTIVTRVVPDTQYQDLLAVQQADPSFTFETVYTYPVFKVYIVKYDPWSFLEHYRKIVGDATSFVSQNSYVGTSGQGIDIWTRTWRGTGQSLILALLVAVTIMTVGLIVGGFIGIYSGTFIDIFMQNVISVYSAVPTIIWYIVIQSFLPPGFWSLYIIFIVTGWLNMVGITSAYMWRYINTDFMKAARAIGVSKWGLIFKHALPNFLGVLLLSFVSAIPNTIEGEASLGFLGFSTYPNGATLGNVLNEMRETVASGKVDNVAYLLLPTFIIFGITMSLNFVALGLTDAVNPKFRRV